MSAAWSSSRQSRRSASVGSVFKDLTVDVKKTSSMCDPDVVELLALGIGVDVLS